MTLSLSANADTIPESTSKLLTARVTDQNGLPKAATIAWSSTDPNIVTVSNGLVTAVARGVASIVASTDGAADTAQILVTENDLILDVQPNAATVAVGDTIDFTATVRTRSGEVVAVNSVNWSLSDPSAAEFVAQGRLLLKTAGDLSIMAEALERRGNSELKVFRSPVASVTLTPGTASIYRGETLTLKATLRDDQGREVRDAIRWGSTDFSKATVTQDGLVTGVGTGSVVITATSDSRTGSATINVMSPAAVNVNLSVPVSTLLVGQVIQAVATATDASGQVLSGKTIGWQSNNPSIATVNSTGEVKGIAEGNVTLSAIIDGVVASTQLTVKGRKASSMSITPSSPSVTVGQQAQLVARVFDQNQVEMTGQAVAWTSSNTTVAAISSTGLMSGYSSGTTTITATSGLLSASVNASVGGTSVSSVRISPASASIQMGATTTLVAEALDANQQVLAGRSATWSSQNPAIATVSSTGLVTAREDGSTVITANIEGKTAGISVTVTPAPVVAVASIVVTSPNVVLDPGQQTQATATLKDANGNVLTGRTVTWSSLDTSVVKVNANGLVTAVAGGTVAVMARSGTVSGSISISVKTTLAAPVAKTVLDAPKQSLTVGESVQTSVTLYDASGNVLSGRTITYTSENPAILSVSATGMVKGLAPGSSKIRATSGGITGEDGFTVTGTVTTVSSIAVTPATTT
ncbi:MAG TPA: Ig-like domain-containing protein, partial [Gemmatimonadaceae bacterium]|nr:Ig-like domain-containing protein [Gemmatimonadaceae bacterium]